MMFTVPVPVAEELLAVSVSTLFPAVGFGLNDAVTPMGNPYTTSVTLPANPFWPETAIVDVPDPP